MRKKRQATPGWGFWRIYIYEFLMVVIIIFLLEYLVVKEYRPRVRHARMVAAVSETISQYRPAVSAYYALHGEWPRDIDAVRDLLPPLPELRRTANRIVAADQITDGAINIQVSLYSDEGKPSILTIRPATPQDDPLGPVRFVVGPWQKLDGWIAAGVDHTTIDKQDMWKEWK